MANGHGGRRRGAGRPRGKSATTERREAVRDLALEKETDTGREAFQFLLDWMRDKELSNRFRQSCVELVLAYLWGRPTQRQEMDVTGDVIIEYVNDWRGDGEATKASPD